MGNQGQATYPPGTECNLAWQIYGCRISLPVGTTTEKLHSERASRLAKGTTNAERWLIGIGIATLLINSAIALIYFGQLKEMRKATDAATTASRTAKDTLKEMQNGQGATDTHTLAQQAVTQATQTTNLANAAIKQTGELRESIQQASRLAKATEEANANIVEADRPWMSLHIQVANFEVGQAPKADCTYTNTGKRTAHILHSVCVTNFYVYQLNPKPPSMEGLKEGSQSIVVPGGSGALNLNIFRVAIPNDYLKEGAPTTDLMNALNERLITAVVLMDVEYEDTRTRNKYFTHACSKYMPQNTMTGSQKWVDCEYYNEAN
jgi:Sec-independent protein translocase protein TatA